MGMKVCPQCNCKMVKRDNEKPSSFLRKKYCSHSCSGKANQTGKKHSKEYKQKMSLIIKEMRKKNPFTKEHNEKIRQANLGKVTSDEIKNKISKTLIGKMAGDKHWNWQGGITVDRERDNDTPQYKQWRKKVYSRDGHACVYCGNAERKLNAHHIKEYSKYPELRYEVANGMTVCIDCHKEIHYGHV